MIRTLAIATVSAAWLGGVSAWAIATASETKPALLTPAHVLAHTRVACGVDRFDEAEQTTVARFTDLSDRALRCVLTGVGAPSYVPAGMARKSPGTGHTSWATGTVDWQHDPEHGLVVTIHVHPEGTTR